MTDLISPDELAENEIHLNQTTSMEELEARVERLERFITQGYSWPAMLTESNLSDTIRETVDHNMWIDVSARLRDSSK